MIMIIISVPEIKIVTKGTIIKSRLSGIILCNQFSILDKIHTPTITPIIPPLPVVRIELSGTSSL